MRRAFLPGLLLSVTPAFLLKMPENEIINSLESPWIKAAGDETFVSMVLENSQQGPVLANFWSKKAGPCMRQYPVLDKVIHQLEGKALLVNINVQSERRVIAELGITSVPTLKLFNHGEVVETAHGYQSEQDLLTMLAPHIMRDSDKALAQAVKLFEAGQRQRAYELLTETILIDPQSVRLPITYAKLLMFDERFIEAENLLEAMPKEQLNRQSAQLKAQCEFLAIAADISQPENLLDEAGAAKPNHDNYLHLQRSLCALASINQDYDTAFDTVDAIINQDMQFDEQFARRAALNLMTLLKAQNQADTEQGLKRIRQALSAYAH
jgi:putative thioredoxin